MSNKILHVDINKINKVIKDNAFYMSKASTTRVKKTIYGSTNSDAFIQVVYNILPMKEDFFYEYEFEEMSSEVFNSLYKHKFKKLWDRCFKLIDNNKSEPLVNFLLNLNDQTYEALEDIKQNKTCLKEKVQLQEEKQTA